jgi:hypothetical protein
MNIGGRIVGRMSGALALATLPAMVLAAPPICVASSPDHRVALVELYTSEGCSSCPPADAWLNRIPAGGNDEVVPLAFHVPYWDYIGWKDPYAQETFSERQSWLVHLNGHRTVYTPHFFLSGTELANSTNAVGQAIKRIDAQSAEIAIRLSASLQKPRLLSIDVDATAPGLGPGRSLFLAVTEDGLTSEVHAGENQGATLHHDHVVRTLIGPLPLANGKLTEHREIPVPSAWLSAKIGVTAFVQDDHSGRVLQVASTESCALSR